MSETPTSRVAALFTVISKTKMKVHWKKVKVQDDDGFSLAGLKHFPLPGLVAGQEENLPAGVVK